MKKLLLLLILIPTLVEARTVNVVVGQPTTVVAADACTACPGSDSDVACEDFETATSGYLCTAPAWTENTDGTGSVVEAAASHSGTFGCADKGSQALQITKASDAWTTWIGARLDTTAAKTTFYYQYYVNVKDAGLTADYTVISVASSANAATSEINHYIRANYVSSSQINFQMRYRNTGGSLAGSATSSTFNEDTWHRIEVEGITNSNTIKFWVDGTLIINASDATNSVDPRYFYLADFTGLADYSVSGIIQYDAFKLDDDTMPTPSSGCP